MENSGAGGALASLIVISVGLLSACTSSEPETACGLVGLTVDHEVVVTVKGASPSTPTMAYPPPPTWAATVCVNGQACTLEIAESGAPIAVRDSAIATTAPVVVTAAVADKAGRVGPAVTTTLTPQVLTPNGPTCDPTGYVATVTVTPTR